MTDTPVTILEAARECGLELSEEKAARLEQYLDAVVQASKTQSLTSLKDRLSLIRELVLDPLLAFDGGWGEKYLSGGGGLVDVGSGTGSPGAPLAIVYQGLRLYPLDSVKKKTAFLASMLKKLELKGKVLEGRAEDIGHPKARRGAFEIACTKAVGAPAVCLELSLPLLTVGGVYLGLFGGDAELKPDANALKELGGELLETREYRLPWMDRPRKVFAVRKLIKTPSRYPRQAGTPSRKPL